MKKICLLAGLLFVPASGFCGDDVGDGTDPTRKLFQKAKLTLPERVTKLKSCSWDQTAVAEEVSNWIMSNRTDFIKDIAKTPHSWITDLNTTCAMTMADGGAAIVFSYPACRGKISTLEEAEHILAHETVHHFGISDEVFPEEVAEAIMVGNPNCSMRHPENVFDPESCAGPAMADEARLRYFPTAATKSREVVHLKAYQRKRLCHKQTGCLGWDFFEGDKILWPMSYGRHWRFFNNVANKSNLSIRFDANGEKVTNRYQFPDGRSPKFYGERGFQFLSQTSSSYKASFKGRVTDSCARYTTGNVQVPSSSGQYYDTEVVYFGVVLPPN